MRFFGRRVDGGVGAGGGNGSYAGTTIAPSRLGARPDQQDAPQAAREADIVAYYRSALLRAHTELSDAWALYDATPDAGYDTRHVKVARQALAAALGEYREACATASIPGVHAKAVAHVVAGAEETDRRIAALEHELNAEVRRFELLAIDVAEDDDAAAADDALTELLAYRSNTAARRGVSSDTIARLDSVEATLRSLLDHHPARPHIPSRHRPPKRPPPAPSPANSISTGTGTGYGNGTGSSASASTVRTASGVTTLLPNDEFERVPDAPEPREFPPIPPPSQQNLTKLVQTAKLYKHEMERNRLSSTVLRNDGVDTDSSNVTLRGALGNGSGPRNSRADTTTSRRGTTLRAGGLRSHSLRVPSLRSHSLRRRNMSHPVPPERDSTLGQRPVDRRSRSMFGMRIQKDTSSAGVSSASTNGGSGAGSGPRRLTSGFGLFSKSLQRDTRESESSVNTAHMAEDPLHTRLSSAMSAMRGDVKSSVIEPDTVQSSGRLRLSKRNDDFGGTRRGSNLSLSVRSFLGMMRQSGNSTPREQISNDAARLRRDSSTYPREEPPRGERERETPLASSNGTTPYATPQRVRASIDVRPKGLNGRSTTLPERGIPDSWANTTPTGTRKAIPTPTPFSLSQQRNVANAKHTPAPATAHQEHSFPRTSPAIGTVRNTSVSRNARNALPNGRRSLSLNRTRPNDVPNGLPNRSGKRNLTGLTPSMTSMSISSEEEEDLFTPGETNGTDSISQSWDDVQTPPSRPSSSSPIDNDVIMKDRSNSSSPTGSGVESSGSSVSSGEALPQGLVLPRAPTLRDHAEFARNQIENSNPGGISDGESMLGNGGALTDGESGRLSVRRTSAASFSTTLYASDQHLHREEAVSDVGVLLTCSRVVGDGRCLFRSIVRGRAVALGESIPKPHQEKKAADRLRAKTVMELRNHRGLLQKFYVIEDNFERYIERMSNPRTYAGEPELLMLAKMLKQPIAVYLLLNGAYRRIQLYGKSYQGDPIRLRYVNDTHYDYLRVCNIQS